MYDSRIAMDLDIAIGCNLVTFTEVPALASNTFTFEVSELTDEYQLIIQENGSITDACEEYLDWVYALHPPYKSYSFSFASTVITDTTLCDSKSNTTASSCIMQNKLRPGQPIVQTMESVPGVDREDIWLNVAAIVGGVQFLAWAVQALIDSK